MRSSYFYWTGMDRRGHVHRGYVRGQNSVEVQAALAVRGVAVLSCAWSWRSLFSRRWWQMWWHQWRTPTRLPRAQQAQWCRNVASLLEAGMSVAHAVRSTALQEMQQAGQRSRLRGERFHQVARLLRAGRPLSTALQAQLGWFSGHMISTIAAAQGTPQLPAVLKELATMLELHDTQQRELHRALAMPLITLGTALVVSVVALSVVVPTLVSVLGEGVALPTHTQQLVNLIGWLREYGLFILFGLVGGGAFLWECAGRYDAARCWRDRALYYVPIAGELLQYMHVAQWLRRVSVQLRAGVPLVIALESIQGQASNRYAQEWQRQLCAAVRRGIPLAVACADVPTRCMPTMVSSLIGLAPHNAALAGIAEQAARLVSQRLHHTQQLLLRLAQPLALVVVGAVVFCAVRALYAPLLQSLSSLTM